MIDHWNAAQVDGCSNLCGPESIFQIAQVPYPWFLAADGGKLYVEGLDPTENYVMVGNINPESLKYKNILTASTSNFYPGGIAFDQHHDITWDDQYGYLLTYAPPYHNYNDVLEYSNPSSPTQDYSAIALDASETTLLAARIAYCGNSTLCSDAQELSYPLGSYGINSASNGDIEDLGIAITPTAKN